MGEIKSLHRMKIGQQLRAIREEQGWTVEQVATMADVKDKTIEKIEAGVFNVHLDVLAKVADILGADIMVKTK